MNQNQEIIEKLEKLYTLLDEAYDANEYAKNGCTQEYGKKILPIIKTVNDLKGVPSIFLNLPTSPVENMGYIETEQSLEKVKKRFYAVLIVTIISFIISTISGWGLFEGLSTVGILASIFFGLLFNTGKNKAKKDKNTYETAVKDYENSMQAYRNALSVYESEKAKGIEAAKQFATEYKEAYLEYDRLIKESEEKRKQAFQTFIQKMDEAKTYDFMPPEYYDLIKPVIKILKSGRADSYKEALNLAIQEQKEAQAEAARRAEEAERTRIMREQAEAEERRAREEQRHNQAMERQQQMHNKAMLEEQRAANKVAEKAAKQQAKADLEMRSAASRMCVTCANNSKCPPSVRGKTINCGGYRPR